MTKKQRREVREARQFSRAVTAVEQGASRREAARIARLPTSTFQERLMRHLNPKPRKSRQCLTSAEEQTFVTVLKRFSDRGLPMDRGDVTDEVEILVDKMSPTHASKLPFRNGSPGKSFCQVSLSDMQMTSASGVQAPRRPFVGHQQMPIC